MGAEATGERGFWTEREAAFALLDLDLVAHFEVTNDPVYLETARRRIDLQE